MRVYHSLWNVSCGLCCDLINMSRLETFFFFSAPRRFPHMKSVYETRTYKHFNSQTPLMNGGAFSLNHLGLTSCSSVQMNPEIQIQQTNGTEEKEMQYNCKPHSIVIVHDLSQIYIKKFFFFAFFPSILGCTAKKRRNEWDGMLVKNSFPNVREYIIMSNVCSLTVC